MTDDDSYWADFHAARVTLLELERDAARDEAASYRIKLKRICGALIDAGDIVVPEDPCDGAGLEAGVRELMRMRDALRSQLAEQSKLLDDARENAQEWRARYEAVQPCDTACMVMHVPGSCHICDRPKGHTGAHSWGCK